MVRFIAISLTLFLVGCGKNRPPIVHGEKERAEFFAAESVFLSSSELKAISNMMVEFRRRGLSHGEAELYFMGAKRNSDGGLLVEFAADDGRFMLFLVERSEMKVEKIYIFRN